MNIIIILQRERRIRMKTKQENQAEKQNLVNIGTMVRVRPLLDSQFSEKQSIIYLNQKNLEVKLSGGKRKQAAEKIFSPQSTQREVFESIKQFIAKSGEGFNVTVFTYGQTGSGKTHTMFGSDWSNIIKNRGNQKSKQSTFLRSIEQDQNHAGLIPRTVNYIFNEVIQKRRKYIKIYCSFLQLYNQQMMDLFQEDKEKLHKKMQIHENKQDGIYVEGLNEIEISSVDQCLEMMQKGERNRVVRQTHMNVKSSRSHTIFQILIEEVFPAKKTYRRMKVNLCDLAGSQKINKGQKMQQEHFQELKNINLSLTTLGKVIGSLSEKDTKKSIPAFRQSKLTRLLQDSLGGNTYTAIIATITSKSSCLQQSLNTLKFLQRAKQIKSAVSAKVFSDNPEMRNLEKQIAYLKDILKMKRTGVEIDVDMTEKMKKLQNQNQKLKQMVDKQLVDKLLKENTHLRQELQRKKNDDLMQSQGSSNFTTIAPKNPVPENQAVLRQIDKSDRASDIYSNYGSTKIIQKQRKLLSTKTYTTKNDNLSTNKASSTKFPSIKTISSNKRSPLSILQRIHEIERVKQANKLRLQQQLSLIGQTNKIQHQASSYDLKQKNIPSSNSSNRYRFH